MVSGLQACIVTYDARTHKHLVQYDGGRKEWLDLRQHRFHWLTPRAVSAGSCASLHVRSPPLCALHSATCQTLLPVPSSPKFPSGTDFLGSLVLFEWPRGSNRLVLALTFFLSDFRCCFERVVRPPLFVSRCQRVPRRDKGVPRSPGECSQVYSSRHVCSPSLAVQCSIPVAETQSTHFTPSGAVPTTRRCKIHGCHLH